MTSTAQGGAGEPAIRRMRKDDLPRLYELLSDARVMRYLEAPYTPEKTEQFLADCGLSPTPRIYAAEDGEGRWIGYVIYHAYDGSSVEIGWVLLPAFWGKGYATALTGLLIERARRERKDAVIECVPAQAASRRIAEKHGFVQEGLSDGLLVYRLRYRPQP